MRPTYLFGVAIIVMFALAYVLPGPLISPPSGALAGLFVMGAGAALSGWATQTLARGGTTEKNGETVTALATTGPYRCSRHPMYLGMILSLTGLAVLLQVTTPWIVPVVFAVALDRLYVGDEERELRATFRDAYRNYASQVRRWL